MLENLFQWRILPRASPACAVGVGRFQLIPQIFLVEEILGANTKAGVFIAIGGTDSSLGCSQSDLGVALPGTVGGFVMGQHQVGEAGDEEPLGEVNPPAHQLIELTKQLVNVNHAAVADYAVGLLADSPRRNQVQHVFFIIDDDGVSGVGSTVKTNHHIGGFAQAVNNLALTFVAPLGTNDDHTGHDTTPYAGVNLLFTRRGMVAQPPN